MSIGAIQIHDPKQIVMTLDHDIQNTTELNLKKYRQIEGFARGQNVDFYPAGRGIGHQIMVEEGYAWPGTLCVASDSHANMYGGVGCLGVAVVRTDAASIWATGKTWWQIPPVAKVTFTGSLPDGVTGKDVIVALCSLFPDQVHNHAIEFTGSEETMQSLSIDDRLAIANMCTEWGALSGLFGLDLQLQEWLRDRASAASIPPKGLLSAINSRFTHGFIEQVFKNKLQPDKGAKYAKELYINLSTLSPYASGPNSVRVATPVTELAAQDIKIDKAYIVSCTNSRASDLAAAAKVFKDAAENYGGRIPKIADGVKLYIAAASLPEQQAAEATGDWQAMIEAGAQPLPSGCGPCIGLGTGLLEPGEVAVSSSNRNFKGRMGSTEAKAYLASPEVVAASSLTGKISGSGRYRQPDDWTGIEFGVSKVVGQLDSMQASAETEFGNKIKGSAEDSESEISVLPGFPEKISGEIIYLDADNINTDGIYPGSMTYQDVTKEDMARACMKNYDPEFNNIAKPGDIIVTGHNFGCGSSREQAATAIIAKGISLVIVGSLANIFSRNSINNALISLEVPKVLERLRKAFPSDLRNRTAGVIEPDLNYPPPATTKETGMVLTRRTGWTLTWDAGKSRIEVTEGSGGPSWKVRVGELPTNVQEIIACGGLEKWVKSQLVNS